MKPIQLYITNQRDWHKFLDMPFGAKQEETYEQVFYDKRNKPRGKATRFMLAEELRSTRKKIKVGI